MTQMSKSYSIRQLAFLLSTKDSRNFFDARSKADHIFQGSRAVRDVSVNGFIKDIFVDDLLEKGLKHNHLTEFKSKFTDWLLSHSTSNIIGLDQYDIDYSSGTTQSFDSFYFRHRNKRFRCFAGEYFYHLKTWISNEAHWSFISDSDPIRENDAVVISMPFCDTGSAHPEYESVISKCNNLGVPVLVDCCYYPISGNVNVDVSAPCIDTVAFSLSKAFPIANLRIGVRYTRNIFDGQKLHDVINYNNNLSAYVGLNLIDKFPSDYIFNQYRVKQKSICEFFNLTPSDAVLFAVGGSEWDQYSRHNLLNVYQLELSPDEFNNRVSLVSMLENWDLFEKIKNEDTVKI